MPGDPQQFAWFLTWTPFALGHGLNPLLTDWIDHPAGVNLMWNTSVPLPALLAAPLTLTAGPVLAYNALLTAGVTLTAWTSELAAARFVTHRPAAVAAGLLAGFSPYLTAHALGHLNLVLAFLPGLALAAGHSLLAGGRRPGWLVGGALGLAIGAQVLTGEEIVAATAVAAAVGLVVWFLAGGRPAEPGRALTGLLAAAVTAAAVSAAPLAIQLFGPQRTLRRPPGTITGNDLAAFVLPSSLQALHPVAAAAGGFLSEQNAYLGVPLLVLLAWAWWRHRERPPVYWAAATALLLMILSLGPHLYWQGRRLPVVLPWRLLSGVPVLDDVLPNRLMLFVYLLAGTVLAVALDQALAAGRRAAAVTAAAAALALVPLVPTLAFPATAQPVPAYFTAGVRQDVAPGAVVLVTPFAAPETMLWQARSGLWFRMPAAYARVPGCGGLDSNLPPPSATSQALARGGTPTPAEAAAVRADLAGWGAREVVVGPGSGAAAALFQAVLGGPGRPSGGVLLFPVDLPPGPVPAPRC